MKLSGTTDDGKIIFNDKSDVEVIDSLEFHYSQSLDNSSVDDDADHSQSTLIDIAALKKCEAFQTNLFTVKGYIKFDEPEYKKVKTRYGLAFVVEDILLSDDSGSIAFHAWKDMFEKLRSGGAYEITHLSNP